MRALVARLILEALLLELVVLDELVGAAVVGIPLVQDVLAHLVEALADVRIVSEQLINNSRVDLRILIVNL